jgi:DNA modification methylase
LRGFVKPPNFDLWLLGEHRIICGDARDPGVYRQLLGSDRADLVFTDPPYNVKISGHVCGSGAVQHREFAMASGEMSEAEFTAFLSAFMACAQDVSRDGALHYVCMDGAHGFELHAAARTAGLAPKITCVWAKSNAGMGSFYRH